MISGLGMKDIMCSLPKECINLSLNLENNNIGNNGILSISSEISQMVNLS